MSGKDKSDFKVTLQDVQQAKNEISQYLNPTPLVYNPWLSEQFGCELYLKLENMQPVGSFKIRGAAYKISKLNEKERKRGVIAASAGNHAQGVAWASSRYKTDALIVMPAQASIIKVENTRRLGAEVHLEGVDYDACYQAAVKLAHETNRVFVHAYEDPEVIAGQGTVGLEIIEKLPEVDYVIGSIGGGGLMAGVGTACKALSKKIKLIGVQASGANAMVQSIKKKKTINIPTARTYADGIAVKKASDRMRHILTPLLSSVCDVDDQAISSAVLTLMEKAKILAEGAAAVPLAAMETLSKTIKGKKVVLIISGGNIDVNLLSHVIDRGLILEGRRLRMDLVISDHPGSLTHVTKIIAEAGGNILQAIHDRNDPATLIDETKIALSIETRNLEHSKKIVKLLTDHYEDVQVINELARH